MSLKLITAPAVEPVTLAEAKAQLRVDHSDDDALITALIVAVREAAEQETGRALITQSWEIALDAFPEAIKLTNPPVASITSIQYYDTDGVLKTLDSADYSLDNADDFGPAWVTPAYGVTWPSTLDVPNAVRVRYVAGYGAAGGAVPAALRQWILLQIGHWYANREAAGERALEKTPFVDRLLDRGRLYWLA